ncbi:helix-turn-helix domain-containing protein [Niabella sp. CJ426]|uniref:helix-turn-helix domain-containing protein n=1 Tax=Niabella sp. CJ426 TaxID=3393740 RepID=UPI003D01B921
MRSLRNALLFTQQDMALLLGVSRSTITMHENGWRELSTAASLMETLIMECYAAATIEPPVHLNHLQEKNDLTLFKKKIRYEIAKCEQDVEVCEEKLIQMKDECLRLQVKQVTLTILKSRLDARRSKVKQGSNEQQRILKQIECVEYFQREAGLLQEKCGILARLELQYQLDRLKAQKRVAENALKYMEQKNY